jgi:hypothetical protein
MLAWVQIGVVVAVVALAPPARAEAPTRVALLPLDAEPRLEIYGQPVASEIARALAAGGIDVVVVGPKMALPADAKLVVHGSIRAGRGDAVTLAVNVRRTIDGKDVGKDLEETAVNLTTIDRAASALAARTLPLVRDQVEKVAKEPPPVTIDPAKPQAPPTIFGGVAAAVVPSRTDSDPEPLRAALIAELTAWGAANTTPIEIIADPAKLAAKTAPKAVGETSHQITTPHGPPQSWLAQFGVLFEVLEYRVDGGDVPLARARVRIRFVTTDAIKFDRVIVTDTVVGSKAMPLAAVAPLVAREILAIARPHLRRTGGLAWKH